MKLLFDIIDWRILLFLLFCVTQGTFMFVFQTVHGNAFPEEEIDCTVVKLTKTMHHMLKEPWVFDAAMITVYVNATKLENVPEQRFLIILTDNDKVSRAMRYFKEGSVHRCTYIGGISNEMSKLDKYFLPLMAKPQWKMFFVDSLVILPYLGITVFVIKKFFSILKNKYKYKNY